MLSSVRLMIAFGGKRLRGAEKEKEKVLNIPLDLDGVAGMGVYVVDDTLGLRIVWEGVRAERKRRVKKAREKAMRITTRGVRIAAICVPFSCVVRGGVEDVCCTLRVMWMCSIAGRPQGIKW